MGNEVSAYKAGVVKAQEIYGQMVVRSFETFNLKMDEYQKLCALNAIAKIQELLTKNGLDFNQIDPTNITQLITTSAILKLNANASPHEVYFQTRKEKDSNGKWKTFIEFGIEGAGNDSILRNYGVDVKKILTSIVVHEGDEFTYQYFDGETMRPITWKPKSMCGKVDKVVYIVVKNDDSRQYLIAERESVKNNLLAHITNNLRAVPNEVKLPIIEKASKMKLDDILDCLDFKKKVHYKDTNGKEAQATIISPSWLQISSREAMIERKLRNNAIKKYPKDFRNSLASMSYESTFDDYEQYREKPIVNEEIDLTKKLEDETDKKIGSNASLAEKKPKEAPLSGEKGKDDNLPKKEEKTPVAPQDEENKEEEPNEEDEEVPFL